MTKQLSTATLVMSYNILRARVQQHKATILEILKLSYITDELTARGVQS